MKKDAKSNILVIVESIIGIIIAVCILMALVQLKKEQIVIVICVLMAMVQFKKEQITQNESDITQKDNVTVLPGGVTIKKIDDDEEYDIRKEK